MTGRPRLLYLAPRYPWPLDRGDRIRGFHLLREFTSMADVTLVALSEEPPEAVDLGPLADWCERVELLPHSRSMARWNMVAAIPTGPPFQVAYYRSTVMDAFLDRLKSEPFDLVFGQLFRMYPYLARFRDSRRILEMTDSLSLNLARAVPAKPWFKRPAFQAERHRVETYEARVLADVEEAWVVTKADREDLLRRAPGSRVVVVPNGVDDLWPSLPARSDHEEIVLLLGNLTVGHNIDMACHLVDDIWPLVRQARPAAQLMLVGAAGPTIQRLASRPGVTVSGFVDDLGPILARARVSVVPLRYGAGIQNKALVTMLSRLPAVVSPIVNEGLGATPGVTVEVAEGAATTAAAIVRLLTSPESARLMGEAGRRHVLEHFSWKPARLRMTELLAGPAPVMSQPR